MTIPAGYALNPYSGFYYFTDGSGPYAISPAGVVYLIGTGPAGPAGTNGTNGAPGVPGPPGPSGVGALDDLSDVVITAPANTQVLKYNSGTSRWENAADAGTGTSLVVQEGDATVVTAADTLDFVAADFDVTLSPAGEANIAASAAIARILGGLIVSGSVSLVAATHANKLLLVDTAGVVFTHNNDATSGLADSDYYDIQAIGAGTFTVIAGTGTLIATDGASINSATAVGKRVQLQRVSANTIRSISATITVGGSSNVASVKSVGNFVAPFTSGVSGVLATIDLSPLLSDGDMATVFVRISGGAEAAEASFPVLQLNGTDIYTCTFDTNNRSLDYWIQVERTSNTTVRIWPNFGNPYVGPTNGLYQSVTVSSLTAGASITIKLSRPALQTKTVTVHRLSALVER
jgi:hypothetical protein